MVLFTNYIKKIKGVVHRNGDPAGKGKRSINDIVLTVSKRD